MTSTSSSERRTCAFAL